MTVLTKKPKHLVFDMDGLLFDTEPLHFEAWKNVFFQLDRELTPMQFADFIGTSDWYVSEWLQKRGISKSIEELIQMKITAFANTLHKLELLPGVKKFLNDAKCKIPMSVASSTQKVVVEKMLELCGIREFFDDVTGGDEVKERKPAPDIFLLAAKRANVDPSDCLAFEDSSPGVTSAFDARMPVIAVPSEMSGAKDFSKAIKVVKSFEELDAVTLLNLE